MSAIIGGKKETAQTGGTQETQFRPEDLAAIDRAKAQSIQANQGYQGLSQNLLQQAQQAGAPQLQTGFNQLQGVQAFNPANAGVDALGRQLVSQGTQALAQQANAQQRALAQQFGGSAGIAQALGRQAAMQSRLQANPLLFQAAQQSVDRGQQGFSNQLGLAGQQAGLQQAANQSLLQQQQAGQSARQEQLGLGGAGTQAAGQLLSQLAQLGQQMGRQVTTGQQQSRSGGILQNFGLK